MIAVLARLLGMIKFPHTVFALPFALTGAFLAARGLPPGRVLFWIVAAMVSARTAAMTFNRLADREFDARNPRTAGRELPRGLVTPAQAWALVGVSIAVFEVSAWRLNRLCLLLSPLALAVILGYSWTKRFTPYSHLVLGLALSLAPAGAWIAVQGGLDPRALVLCLAVLTWVAGFDILYAMQDVEFDRREGLYSLPVHLGPARALTAARLLHGATVLLLAWLGALLRLGAYYGTGVAVVAGLLAYEHSLVRPHDLSRLDRAFFNMNGYISLTVLAFTLLDLLV